MSYRELLCIVFHPYSAILFGYFCTSNVFILIDSQSNKQWHNCNKTKQKKAHISVCVIAFSHSRVSYSSRIGIWFHRIYCIQGDSQLVVNNSGSCSEMGDMLKFCFSEIGCLWTDWNRLRFLHRWKLLIPTWRYSKGLLREEG